MKLLRACIRQRSGSRSGGAAAAAIATGRSPKYQSINVAVCVLREQPPPHKQRTGTTRLFSQLPTVGIELFVLLPAPGVEAWTKAAKTQKKK